MQLLARWIGIVLLLGAGACRLSSEGPPSSLVGANDLPAPEMLSRETIYISRGYGLARNGSLSFELRPDDVLTVASNRSDLTPQLKEQFLFAAGAATRTRRALWRLRPEKLRGAEWETLPANCPKQPSDVSPDVAVAFIAPGTQARPEENEVESFVLPPAAYCHSSDATEARALIQSVMRSFPQSHVAREFEKRTKLPPL